MDYECLKLDTVGGCAGGWHGLCKAGTGSNIGESMEKIKASEGGDRGWNELNE